MVKSYAKIPSVTDGESITDAIIRVHNLIRETEFHVPVATFTQWQLESWTLEFMKYKERAVNSGGVL